jgi:heme-degrading monooxygenase HmoA
MTDALSKPFARRLQACALALITLGACGDDDGKSDVVECNAATLESDNDPSPWMGPAADASGKLQLDPSKKYVVSTTYGMPVPGPDGAPVTAMYQQIFGRIQQQLMSQQGLLALNLAGSDKCASGRTLAVWESEDAMYDFVTSDAHTAAMTNVHTLLKPGYAVTHYQADALAQISWEAAVPHLAEVGKP